MWIKIYLILRSLFAPLERVVVLIPYMLLLGVLRSRFDGTITQANGKTHYCNIIAGIIMLGILMLALLSKIFSSLPLYCPFSR
ncbi:MAG: hypothetical protein GPOALKHO_000340 [Sodalis sp.]|nr:MAG: hypothetical protein GPOALKHO_000340 [Sodalis sp.]